MKGYEGGKNIWKVFKLRSDMAKCLPPRDNSDPELKNDLESMDRREEMSK